MARTIIVARLKPNAAEKIRDAFAESDATGLPERIGVLERRLYAFHDVYLHSIDTDDDGPRLADATHDERWLEINRTLREHIDPFDPSTWRGPRDAMAHEFYRWTASGRDAEGRK